MSGVEVRGKIHEWGVRSEGSEERKERERRRERGEYWSSMK